MLYILAWLIGPKCSLLVTYFIQVFREFHIFPLWKIKTSRRIREKNSCDFQYTLSFLTIFLLSHIGLFSPFLMNCFCPMKLTCSLNSSLRCNGYYKLPLCNTEEIQFSFCLCKFNCLFMFALIMGSLLYFSVISTW